MNDAGVALVVMAKWNGWSMEISPLVTIKTYAAVGLDPTMGLGPVYATRKAWAKIGPTLMAMDLIEFNEAFAAKYGREFFRRDEMKN